MPMPSSCAWRPSSASSLNSPGAFCICFRSWRIASRISTPWLCVRTMSLVGKSWRSRENASAWPPFMWCGPGVKYAPEYGVVHLAWAR